MEPASDGGMPMSEGGGGGLQVVYNIDRILDCHTT